MPDYQPYRITKKRQLTPTVYGFTLEPQTGSVFDFKPGQFVMLGLYDDQNQITVKKAYSICTAPVAPNNLEVGFKVQGNFTQSLAKLNEQDTIGVAGPFGVFTLPDTIEHDLVFLGGGIGITPLLSMIRTACERNVKRNLLLMYAVRSPEEVAFRKELETLAETHPQLRLVLFAESAPADWSGETGRITPEKLEQYASPLVEKQFFICGPTAFITCMIDLLKTRGVSPEQIKLEKF